VRQNYRKIAIAESAPSCCGTEECKISPADISLKLGYSNNEVNAVPDGANMGLGCGNPQAIAALKPGETVLDLGSGGGIDSFLAANAVGKKGRVVGVDMTPEMISKARQNTVKAGFKNVEFRLGEIENLPVADNSVDVIISNCVINLSPAKNKVFNEAFRVLKPGGRLAISDIVATAVLPDEVQNDLALLTGCISGASQIDELESMLEMAGFSRISIQPKKESKQFIRTWAPQIEDFIVSATIEAVKPI
jgi:ubiquinone/menaquinone biosynthesis C-methylase UbiE